jgi:magnesium transporter
MDMELNEEIQVLISEKKFDKLKEIVKSTHSVQIAALFSDLGTVDIALVFRLLEKDVAIEVFEYLDVDEKERLLNALQDAQVIELLNQMSPDDRTELFEELPAKVVKKYLSLLTPEKRKIAYELLGYQKGTAGRLMTPAFVDLKEHQTVEQALAHIRETAPIKETIYYCYVMSPLRHLVGFVSLRELIMASPSQLVREIMHTDVVKVSTDDDQEDVARILSEYDLIAVPVVDRETRLVGIITYDDILDVVEEETTEDIHLMGGLSKTPADDKYIDLTISGSVRKRVGWLIFLVILGSLSGSVIKVYSDILDTLVALSFFVPMLINTGGNAGTQSSTLVTRAIAMGEFSGEYVWKVIAREGITGIILGGLVAAFGFGRVYITEGDIVIGLLVAISLVVIVIIANIVGVLLPLVAYKLKFDPAVMSAPLITTIVDVVGLLAYFQIARIFLQL